MSDMNDTANGFSSGGVLAAVLTPMRGDLSVDHRRLAAHCRWLLDNGCDGLAVLGTTGEANSLTLAERLEILDNLDSAGIPGQALMAGTGCCAFPDTVVLSRRAVELGAGGVLMLPPFYYKSVSDDGLFASYAEIIERVGDERLKIYLYHFPKMSAVPIGAVLVERLLKRYPHTIAGMKDSSGDLSNMTAMARAFPGFAVFSGTDQHLAPLLEKGGAGGITAVCNVASSLAAEVYRGNGSNGEANSRLAAVRGVIGDYPLSAALKEIMAGHSGDSGWLNIRPPLTGLGGDMAAELFGRLDEIGFAPPPAR